MDCESFQRLPTHEIAGLVHSAGPKVCAFPINGTRRWFAMEYPGNYSIERVLDIQSRRHIEIYKMLFDHGIDTVLAPVFGPDLAERGNEYIGFAVEGLKRLSRSKDFLDFYFEYDVRCRFYGDYQKYFDRSPYEHVMESFEEATAQTKDHRSRRIFFGICGNDATETIAELGWRFQSGHGRLPSKREIIEMYYGEYIEPVDIFIGFGKFCAFDMPLVATGNEDLYFTVIPSLYMTQKQLRDILYDHLYNRCEVEPAYAELSREDLAEMRRFYLDNSDKTLGIGRNYGGLWYPLIPEVEAEGHGKS